MAGVTGLVKDRQRLAWVLGTLWLVLLLPTLLLGYQVYQQLRYESMHQYRASAETVAERINLAVEQRLAVEELRPVDDYWSSYDGVRASPLADARPEDLIPGLVGYFRLDSSGSFGSPQRVQPNSAISSGESNGKPGGETDTLASREEPVAPGLALQAQLQAILLSAQERRELAASAQTSSDTDSELAEARQDADVSLSDSLREVTQTVAVSKRNKLEQQSNQVLFEKLSRSRREAEPAPAAAAPVEELALETAYYDENKRSLAKKKSTPKAKLNVRDKRTNKEMADFAGRGDAIENAGELASQAAPAPSPKPALVSPARAAAKQDQANRAIEDIAAVAAAKDGMTNSASPQVLGDSLDREMDLNLSDSALATGLFTDEFMRLEMIPLNQERLLFFRRAYVRGERYVQGFILDQEQFLQETVGRIYAQGQLAGIGDLSVAFDGRAQFSVLANNQTDAGSYLSRGSRSQVGGGELLYRRNLPSPLDSMELLFSARELPVATGSSFVLWSLGVLLALLCAGFVLLFMLGKKQLQQRQQQQDFISAVSHELKTPLTSIRMYGEMLKSGWVTEDKREEYYDYIFNESERLSRLIGNVLQLSKVSRGQQELNLAPMSVGEILDLVESRTDAHLKSAGYELVREVPADALSCEVLVEQDAMVQVMINLIDNAVKFSAGTDNKQVEVGVRTVDQNVVFSVRDFGPGIAKDQLRKIFDLFYRSEDELTRETVGTGIGLALVQQLVGSMQGSVSARNVEPGAQFQVRLPLAQK